MDKHYLYLKYLEKLEEYEEYKNLPSSNPDLFPYEDLNDIEKVLKEVHKQARAFFGFDEETSEGFFKRLTEVRIRAKKKKIKMLEMCNLYTSDSNQKESESFSKIVRQFLSVLRCMKNIYSAVFLKMVVRHLLGLAICFVIYDGKIHLTENYLNYYCKILSDTRLSFL